MWEISCFFSAIRLTSNALNPLYGKSFGSWRRKHLRVMMFRNRIKPHRHTPNNYLSESYSFHKVFAIISLSPLKVQPVFLLGGMLCDVFWSQVTPSLQLLYESLPASAEWVSSSSIQNEWTPLVHGKEGWWGGLYQCMWLWMFWSTKSFGTKNLPLERKDSTHQATS